MGKAFTALSVEKAKSGAKRLEIPDGLLIGLYLVVQPSSAKSWAVRYRREGKTRKLTLGAYPGIDLANARELLANRVLAAIRRTFNWAIDRGVVENSPCVGVRPPSAERSRDRVASRNLSRRATARSSIWNGTGYH